MKVILVGPTHPHRGGIVHYTHSLANALAAQPGVQARLLTYEHLFPKVAYKAESDPSVEPLPLDSRIDVGRLLSWGNPLAWRRGARWAAGADVLHFQSWTGILSPSMAAVARVCKRGGTRVAVTLHNVQAHEGWHRILDGRTRGLLRCADLVVVHAPSLRDAAIAAYRLDARKVQVIPHGLYDSFDRGRFTREAARQALGLPAAAKVLLFFGTIRDYKGLDVAIRVLQRLPEEFVLVVAGKPWGPWEPYAELARSHGVSARLRTFLGYVADEDVEKYCRAADVSLLPYRSFAGQSGQALMTAAFGLPIVASRVGGLADLIEPAFLVDAGDEVGFAETIRRAVQHRGSTLREDRAPTWDQVAKATVGAYGL